MIRSIFAAVCIVAISSAAEEENWQKTYPSLKATVDGVETQLYVQYAWPSIETDGYEFSFDQNKRGYLSYSETVDTSRYFNPNLLGGVMEYDVDLSKVGCGCDTALYGVRMPALDNTTDQFQYCDGNQVGGHWCPEFDIMEANKYSFNVVGHSCDAPVDGVYQNCDRSGKCKQNILVEGDANAYGPSDSYTIDTTKQFHVKTWFNESNGQFVGFKTQLSQAGGRWTNLETGYCDDLISMTDDIKQLTIVTSNWGDDNLNWLQHDSCTGSCSKEDTFQKFSNLSFQSAEYLSSVQEAGEKIFLQ